jgi:hypothetical protein
VGCASVGGSLCANWLYLGIPDLNPFPLFEHFIVEQRFGLWTSRLQQYYIGAISGGVLTLNPGGGIGIGRELRSLLGAIYANRAPIVAATIGLLALAVVSTLPARRWLPRQFVLLLGVLLGYALYRLSLRMVLDDLALGPVINRTVLYVLAGALYLTAVRSLLDTVLRPFVLGLLGYWLICAALILVFHSTSMERLMRHADVVGVVLLLVALVQVIDRNSTRAIVLRLAGRTRSFQLRKSAAVPLLLALGIAFSLRAGASAWTVDPLQHLLASTLGLQGRATDLTHPMARFERCEEIARSVPATARVLFLNAYTAMAYCNNAVLLPRTMIVEPHESDFARDIAVSSFADADTVEQTLRHLNIDFFLVLKGDSEFWASGLSAPFRPGELARRFDLLAETPSFYILTWRGAGHPIPPQTLEAISEWRRVTIQHHGFMVQNDFVGQWRVMARLGADRPKYVLGRRLDFTSKGWSALYADHGWYQADPDGTWTVGPVAVVRLPLAQPSAGGLRITMEAKPYLPPQLTSRAVHVRVGSAEIAIWTFAVGDEYQTKVVALPPGAAANSEIVLTFEIENSVLPLSLGRVQDWRPLGMSVRSLIVEDLTPQAQ